MATNRTATKANVEQAEMEGTQSGFTLEGVPLIYQLIGKAMAEIGAIGKDSVSKNASGKEMYKFRGIDAVYNALNPVMAKYGLFITPEILDQKREERRSSNNNLLIYSIVTIRFTMYAPDGSFVQTTVIGEGMDSGDKATNKAMSVALKYAMFQMFMIPTEEMKDSDADTHDVMTREQQRQAEMQERTFNRPQTQPGNASVSTSSTVPPAAQQNAPAQEPPKPKADLTTAKGYVCNELVFMAQLLGIDNQEEMFAKFEEMRKPLADQKVIPDKKVKDMTLDEAKIMVEAIYSTYFQDKKGQEGA